MDCTIMSSMADRSRIFEVSSIKKCYLKINKQNWKEKRNHYTSVKSSSIPVVGSLTTDSPEWSVEWAQFSRESTSTFLWETLIKKRHINYTLIEYMLLAYILFIISWKQQIWDIYTWETAGRQSRCRGQEARQGPAETVCLLLSPNSSWWEEAHVGAVKGRRTSHHITSHHSI